MSLYDRFKVSTDRVKNGVRFELDGCGFTCAHAGQLNPRWMKTAELVYKPYRHQTRTNTLSDEKTEELELEVFCTAVLVDWDGVTDKSGSVLPYSRQNAIQLMKELPYLHNLLGQLSRDIENYRDGVSETDVKS